MTTANELLGTALEVLESRGSSRDNGRERSMKKTVEAFNIMYDKDLTVEEGWMFMVLLKVSRSTAGVLNTDDYIDGAGYFSLAGEEATKASVDDTPFLGTLC